MTDDERHTIAVFRSMQAGLHIDVGTSPQVGGGIAIPSKRARRHLGGLRKMWHASLERGGTTRPV
jgi:hypothetical protein